MRLKLILFCSYLLLVAPSTWSQCCKTERQQDYNGVKLYGKVKSVTTFWRVWNDSTQKWETQGYDLYTYDRNRNNTGYTHMYILQKYGHDTVHLERNFYTYSEYSQIVGCKTYLRIGGVADTTIRTNVYDNSGRLEKLLIQRFAHHDTSIDNFSKLEYVHDMHGNLVQTKEYNMRGELSRWYIYRYDGRYREISKTHFPYGESVTHEYDEADGMTISNYRYRDGCVSNWYRTWYDSHGNETETQTITPDGRIVRTQLQTYDADNNKLSNKYYESDSITKTTFHYSHYDKHGNYGRMYIYPEGVEIKSMYYKRVVEYY